jgi:chorismate-pyruvate lyase
MTPTLEDHYGCDIHIEVLSRRRAGKAYFREVILRLDRDQRPVEFGANKISLEMLEPEVQRLVLAEHLPLGHILKMLGVPHQGRPHAFFRVHSDELMNRAFGLSESALLYGRRNTLRDPQGRALSRIVEILPP